MAANGHGGAREGAGRKPGELKSLLDKPVRAAEKQIVERLPRLLANLFILADGVMVEEDIAGENGEPIRYTKPPDRQANEYLINRVMGKPTDKSEAEVNLKGGVTIFLPARQQDQN